MSNTFENEDCCSICTSTTFLNKTKLDCGHYYCNDCISSWFNEKLNCPICRKELTFEEHVVFASKTTELKLEKNKYIYTIMLFNQLFFIFVMLFQIYCVFTSEIDIFFRCMLCFEFLCQISYIYESFQKARFEKDSFKFKNKTTNNIMCFYFYKLVIFIITYGIFINYFISFFVQLDTNVKFLFKLRILSLFIMLIYILVFAISFLYLIITDPRFKPMSKKNDTQNVPETEQLINYNRIEINDRININPDIYRINF